MSNDPSSAMPVLLVEDNEIDVEITRRVLTRCGLGVTLSVARDGKEALERLRPGVPARRDAPSAPSIPRLVLLDLGLPVVEGREVLRRIKDDATLCPIPVVLLTGNTGERSMRECMDSGGNMYLVKPLTVTEAVNIITAVRKYWTVMEKLSHRTA